MRSCSAFACSSSSRVCAEELFVVFVCCVRSLGFGKLTFGLFVQPGASIDACFNFRGEGGNSLAGRIEGVRYGLGWTGWIDLLLCVGLEQLMLQRSARALHLWRSLLDSAFLSSTATDSSTLVSVAVPPCRLEVCLSCPLPVSTWLRAGVLAREALLCSQPRRTRFWGWA